MDNDFSIPLKSFSLFSLFHTSKEDLQFLKSLSNDSELMEYMDSLMYYVGKKHAYIIKQNDKFIGFLNIANDSYRNSNENNKELYIVIVKEFQKQGLASKVIEEVSEYLFQIEDIDNIVIAAFNKHMVSIATKLGFDNTNNVIFIKKNPNKVFKL